MKFHAKMNYKQIQKQTFVLWGKQQRAATAQQRIAAGAGQN